MLQTTRVVAARLGARDLQAPNAPVLLEYDGLCEQKGQNGTPSDHALLQCRPVRPQAVLGVHILRDCFAAKADMVDLSATEEEQRIRAETYPEG